MKQPYTNQYVNLYNKQNNSLTTFDRSLFVEGTTRSGLYIPAGGVLLQNNSLAGYIQKGGQADQSKRVWRIVGQIKGDDDVLNSIPMYGEKVKMKSVSSSKHSMGIHGNPQKGGREQKKSNKNRREQVKNSSTHQDGGEKPVLSLKDAVNMLREYYRNEFN